MNENTKILVLAALVLVVAIVSFNLNITGKVAAGETTITVNPSKIIFAKDLGGGIKDSASKIVNVAFKNIDGRGLDKQVDLYKVRSSGLDTKVGIASLTICNRNICYDDVVKPYKVSAGLIGYTYYFKATRSVGFGQPDNEFTSNKFIVE